MIRPKARLARFKKMVREYLLESVGLAGHCLLSFRERGRPLWIGRWAILLLAFFCCLSCSNSSNDSRSDRPEADVALAEEAVPVEKQLATPTSDPHNASGSGLREDSQTRETSSQLLKSSHDLNPVASITTSKSSERHAAVEHDIDPRNDGWDSEVFAGKAGEQIKRLGALLQSTSEIEPRSLEDLVTEDFSCSLLRPQVLEKVFDDGSISAKRSSGTKPSPAFFGTKGLAQAVESLRKSLEGTIERHTKFKLIRVSSSEYEIANEISTTVLFESSGRKAEGVVQSSATWQCRWKIDPGKPPRLSWIGVTAHEEAASHFPNRTLFSDCTESIFETVPAYARQLQFGVDYWRDRLETYLGMYFNGHHGMALGDVNGDGLDDLYICEPGGLPNRLFLQTEDGALRDISAESGVDFLDHSRSALLLDLDNDGDQDLVLSIENRLKVFFNDGQAVFQLSASLEVGFQKSYSISSADFDQDGDLDIYACFYHGTEFDQNRLPDPLPYHDARNGGPNRLFRNEGKGQFVDATDEVGLGHNNFRWSFASAWEDIDNDGDQDLYVVNDYGRNNLYRNDGGQFTDVAEEVGAQDQNFGMSVSFGDYNRDGWMDIYVSNMFSSAGGRVTYQPQFQTGSPAELKADYQQLARGNSLIENLGKGLAASEPSFLDVSEEAGVTMGRWAWGSLFADINNDGWEDLVVANGFVTGKRPDDL